MTSTEIAVRQPAALVTERDVVDGWITVVADVAKLSDHIAETEFVPKALRNKPAAIAACILTGRELGIGPMASLKSIHMVQGVPSLSAEYKRARALAAGHQIVVDDSNATRCVVRGRRAGSESWLTIQWTMDMANRAKISGKDVWKQYPQRMLQARATSELCDLLFPDATLGLPTTEELEDGGLVVAAEVAVAAAAENGAEPAKPAARTAQRRQRTTEPKPDPTPPASGTQQASPAPPSATGATADGLPPLPGEDDPDPTPGPPQDTGSPLSSSAAGEPQPSFDPDQHGSATRGKGGQLTALWTVLNEVYEFPGDDVGKRQARAVVEHIIARPLDGDTTGDLSYNEAKTVLDTLASWKNIAESRGDHPRDVMIAVMAEAGQQQPEDGAHG
jgi:hypothetical protein